MELTEQQFVAAVRRYFGLSEAVRQSDSYEALRAEITAALNAWTGKRLRLALIRRRSSRS